MDVNLLILEADRDCGRQAVPVAGKCNGRR